MRIYFFLYKFYFSFIFVGDYSNKLMQSSVVITMATVDLWYAQNILVDIIRSYLQWILLKCFFLFLLLKKGKKKYILNSRRWKIIEG